MARHRRSGSGGPMMRRATALLVLALVVVAVAPPDPVAAQGDEIQLLTPKKGQGIRPVFRWASVEGATEYLLVVLDKRGRAYWSWQGSETEIPMGGGEKPSKPGSGAPRVAKGYKWIVS